MKRTVLLIALFTAANPSAAAPWTYRGTLNDGGKPANGNYDLRLTLINDEGTQSVSQPLTLHNVAVKNGEFSAEVDFGFDLSKAPLMKLKTEVSQADSIFEALGEPTRFDAKAALAGACSDTEGNVVQDGEFIGSTNNVPLKLKANNSVIGIFTSRGTPTTFGDAPSVALGSSANEATALGATVSGGGATRDGMGGFAAFENRATGIFSTVSGGMNNDATNSMSTVSGGTSNIASGVRSTVGGGENNCAGGDHSWAGGHSAKIRPGNGAADGTCVANSADTDGDNGTFLWADDQFGNFTSTGPRQFAIRASGGLRWDGTGVNSTTSPAFTHQAIIGTNTCDANTRTVIDHPILNGNPNAVIVMTPNYGDQTAGTAPPRGATGVYYSNGGGGCAANRWVIYQLAVTAETLNPGVKFNVWFVIP